MFVHEVDFLFIHFFFKFQKELEELIETRNSTRVELYESLSACLADLSNIPLEDKLNQMQVNINWLVYIHPS